MSGRKLAIATGGRSFVASQRSTDDLIAALDGVVLLVHGDAPGFDRWAAGHAGRRRILIQPVPALWDLISGDSRRQEGHHRNRRMKRWALEVAEDYELEPILIAGPGGSGTANMRRLCWDLRTVEVRP